MIDRVSPAAKSRYSVDRIVWAVRAVSRRVPKATWLTQALVAQRLLLKSGHRCRLRMGAANETARGFEAQSWVEYGGRVVIGERAGTSITDVFTPMAAWNA